MSKQIETTKVFNIITLIVHKVITYQSCGICKKRAECRQDCYLDFMHAHQTMQKGMEERIATSIMYFKAINEQSGYKYIRYSEVFYCHRCLKTIYGDATVGTRLVSDIEQLEASERDMCLILGSRHTSGSQDLPMFARLAEPDVSLDHIAQSITDDMLLRVNPLPLQG